MVPFVRGLGLCEIGIAVVGRLVRFDGSEGNAHADARAAPGELWIARAAAHQPDPFTHAHEAKALAFAAAWIEADALIGDLQINPARLPFQLDGCAPRLAVPDDVVQSLLRDPVETQGNLGRSHVDGAPDAEVDLDLVLVGHIETD